MGPMALFLCLEAIPEQKGRHSPEQGHIGSILPQSSSVDSASTSDGHFGASKAWRGVRRVWRSPHPCARVVATAQTALSGVVASDLHGSSFDADHPSTDSKISDSP